MRTKELNVPIGVIEEVAGFIAENEITNTITGATGDEEIIVSVSYEKGEGDAILELIELIDDHNEEAKE